MNLCPYFHCVHVFEYNVHVCPFNLCYVELTLLDTSALAMNRSVYNAFCPLYCTMTHDKYANYN